MGLKPKKCQFGRYFVITFKAQVWRAIQFFHGSSYVSFVLVSKESIYNSPFTASVNGCRLLQEEITTPLPLTGSGDAGFGKRSELPLANLSLKFLRLK